MYLGAKHMVTGYDHLLFLVGVIFFLYRLKDVVTYVRLFTLGHSLTLLAGVLGDIRVNRTSSTRSSGCRWSTRRSRTRRVRGVVRRAAQHQGRSDCLRLVPRLRPCDETPGARVRQNGLVANIVSFNVGVEIGQFLALAGDSDRPQLLADAQRVSAPRVPDQLAADVRRLSADRLSAVRIHAGRRVAQRCEGARVRGCGVRRLKGFEGSEGPPVRGSTGSRVPTVRGFQRCEGSNGARVQAFSSCEPRFLNT